MPHFDTVSSQVVRVTKTYSERTPEQIDMPQSCPLLAKIIIIPT